MPEWKPPTPGNTNKPKSYIEEGDHRFQENHYLLALKAARAGNEVLMEKALEDVPRTFKNSAEEAEGIRRMDAIRAELKKNTDTQMEPRPLVHALGRESSDTGSAESMEEHPTENIEEFLLATYKETENGIVPNRIRGEVVERRGNERIIRPVSVGGVPVNGWLAKFDKNNLKTGEPFRYTISTDGGKTFGSEQESGKLGFLSGTWERGIPVTLDDLYTRTDRHALSENLPDNTEALAVPPDDNSAAIAFETKYRQQMLDYEYTKEADDYAQQHPESSKCNFAFNADANVGWKVHLNVTQENVQAVAAYLKQEGYYHKYLMGGTGIDGKVFTVYFGAKSIMDKWAPQLSINLRDKLCKPLVKEEVEVAPGVVGRFTNIQRKGNARIGEEFDQYGYYGTSTRRGFIEEKKRDWKYIHSPQGQRESAKDAYEHLSEIFGSYFHG